MNKQKYIKLINSGKYQEAFNKLSKIVKRSPDNPEAWFLLSFIYKKQRQQLYSLEKALNINPDYKDAAHRISEVRSGTRQITPIDEYFKSEVPVRKKRKGLKPFLTLIVIGIVAIGLSIVALKYIQSQPNHLIIHKI